MIARLKKLWAGIVGAMLAAGAGFFFVNKAFVHSSYDLPFAPRQTINPTEAIIVYLDEESARQLGQPHGQPWDRAIHAKLLDRLTADGVSSVTYDIFFADAADARDPDKQKGDQMFAEAIQRNGKVILAANFVHFRQGIGQVVRGKSFITPFDLIADKAANLASVELNPDQDLIVRQHLPFPKDDLVPPLAWATAEFVGAPVTTNEANRTAQRWINYYGIRGTIPSVAFHRVLSENPEDGPLPSGYFSNKSVFVGGVFTTRIAADRKDEFPTPFTSSLSRERSEDQFSSGLEIHATVFLNLLRGDWLNRTGESAEYWMIALTGLICGFLFISLRPANAASLALVASVAIVVLGYYMHTRLRLWFPWNLLSFVVIPTAVGWAIIHNSIVLYVQKRLFEQSLSLYLSPKLVKKFATREQFLRTGAEKQTLTILFSDIANFTSLSEGMDGDQLAKLMNGYFDRAIPHCIFKTDGTVMKYIGDAIFAVWNAPDLQPDHATRACRASLLLRDGVAGMSLGESGPPLRTRIGLHTGVANIGNFGSKERFGYDAVGENINLASRMEGLNKYLGTDVLITGDTQREVEGQFVVRRLGLFRLKGFEKAVDVYEMVSELDKAGESQSWREAFAKGLECWERQSFEPAEAAFRRTLESKPNDGPSKFFLERITDLKTHPPDGEWDGVVELKEK